MPTAVYTIEGRDKTAKAAKSAKRNMGGVSSAFKNAAQSAAIMDGPLSGASGRLSAVGGALTSINPAVVGLGVAVAGTVKIVSDALSVYSEWESQNLKIESLLKATGNASGKTADEIDRLALAVADETLASASGVREAAGVMLTFKSISGDTFDEAIRLSQDMAAVMGGDIKQSALQLAKALEEPATGLTALRRSGVSFTEAEKDLIKSLAKTGDTAEAQRLILEKLQSQLGGAGAAAGGGLAGATDLVSGKWEHFLDTLADETGIADLAQGALNLLARGLEGVTTALAGSTGQDRIDELTEKIRGLRDELRGIGEVDESDPESNANWQREGIERLIATYQREQEEIRNRIAAKKDEKKAALEGAAAAQAEAEQARLAAERSAAAEKAAEEAERQAKEDAKYRESLEQKFQMLERSLFNEKQLILADHQERVALTQEMFDNDLISNNTRDVYLQLLEQEKQKKLTALARKGAEDRAKAEQWASKTIASMRQGAYQQGVGLLQSFAGQSKKAAIAVIALEKGLKINQVIGSTQAAMMRAMAELGPIAGPPAAAGIKLMGAASIGLIAATGLRQAYVASQGGAASIPTSGGGSLASGPALDAGGGFDQPQQIIEIHIAKGGTIVGSPQSLSEIVVDGLREAVGTDLIGIEDGEIRVIA